MEENEEVQSAVHPNKEGAVPKAEPVTMMMCMLYRLEVRAQVRRSTSLATISRDPYVKQMSSISL